MHEYNLRAARDNRPKLDVLRVCRFSSGSYAKAGVETGEVAQAIHQGIMAMSRRISDEEPLQLAGIQYEDGGSTMKLFSNSGIQEQPQQQPQQPV